MNHSHKEPNPQHTLSVYFCGQEDCGPAHSFGPAMRPHYLLHVIFRGRGIYQRGSHTYHLKAGDAFLIRPMDSIYYRADDTDPWSYAWAGFDGSACQEILSQTVFSSSLVFTPETPSQGEKLLEHMSSLISTFSESNGNDLASAGNLLLVLSAMQKKPSEIKPGQKVVIIDDLIATGGSVEAAIKLVEELGGIVVKVVFLMELAGLKGRERLKGYDVASVIRYDGK